MSEHKDTPLIISFSTLFECYFIRKEKDSKIKKVEERHARYCGIDFFIELLSMMELNTAVKSETGSAIQCKLFEMDAFLKSYFLPYQFYNCLFFY